MNQQLLVTPQGGGTTTLLGSQPLYIRTADAFSTQQGVVGNVQQLQPIQQVKSNYRSHKTFFYLAFVGFLLLNFCPFFSLLSLHFCQTTFYKLLFYASTRLQGIYYIM